MIRRAALAAGLTAATAMVVVGASVGASIFAYHKAQQHAELDAGRTAAAPHLAATLGGQSSARSGALAIKGRFYYGAITSNLPGFDKMAGANANLTVNYVAWGRPVSEYAIEQDAALGAQVMEVLEPYSISLRKVVAGKGDAYLRNFAQRIVASKGHVLLSFAPEMNGWWYSWGKVSAATYVKAYRHVHSVISSIAGKDVTWVWQVSHVNHRVSTLRPLWPGSKYVSVIGVDGYFRGPGDTFASVIGGTVKSLRKFSGSVPIVITETAAGKAASKVAKIPLLFAGIRHMRLHGFIWFDHQPWQLDGSRPVIRAFRAGLKSVGIHVK